MIWEDEEPNVPEAVEVVKEPPPSLDRAPTSSLVVIFMAGVLAAGVTQHIFADRGWMWLAVLCFYTFLGAAVVASMREM